MNDTNQETLQVAEVGTPATYCVGSDRYAYTVTKVSKSGSKITLTRDTDMNVAEGHYERNDNGDTMVAYRGQDGKYRYMGRFIVRIGVRETYRCPEF